MYDDYYKLSGRPFQLTPDPKYYFQSRSHDQVIDYLSGDVKDPDGFVLITGDIGTGKTTLARHIQIMLGKSNYVCGMMSNTRIEGEDLLVTMLTAFELNARESSLDGLLNNLREFAQDTQAKGDQAVLVIDEAQNLSNKALVELHDFIIGDDGTKQLMHCLLIGQLSLRERIFSGSTLKSFAESVSVKCELKPLDADETTGYLMHRLKMVGWDNNPVFTDEALTALHDKSGGIPRQLNALCGRFLLYGALEELKELDLEDLESVSEGMAEETKLNASHRERITSLSYSGISKASTEGAHDATSPLEYSGHKEPQAHQESVVPEAGAAEDDDSEVDERLDKLEEMMKSQDASLQQLTSLLTQFAQKK